MNKFAVRMARHMNSNNPTGSFSKDLSNNDESDSSTSQMSYSHHNSHQSYRRDAPIQDSYDQDDIQFSHIPAMSTDGMYDNQRERECEQELGCHNENEEED